MRFGVYRVGEIATNPPANDVWRIVDLAAPNRQFILFRSMPWPDPSCFRSRRNYWIACLTEAGSPLFRGISVLRNLPPGRPPDEWRRALLLGASHIGDVLYNTGSLPALKQGLPNCSWTYVASPPAVGVLDGNPALAGTISRAEAFARISEFDAVVCYDSSGYWRDLLAAWRCRVPNRAGYVHKGFSALASHPIPIRRDQPYPAYFRDLVAHLTGLAPDWPIRPLVYPDPSHESAAAQLWNSLGLGDRPVVAAFVTSRQRTGVWPAEKFGDVLRHIHGQVNCDSVLLGSAEDETVLTSLRDSRALSSQVVAGRLPLLALVCFLRRCRAVLSTDSGPRHLANAAGVPVFFVPNIAVSKIETGRYLETEFDLAPELELVAPGDQAAAFARIDPCGVADRVVHLIQTR